jgi:hypothetical protein
LTSPKRPTAVKVLAILHVLLGILLILGGFTLTIIGLGVLEMFRQFRPLAARSLVLGIGFVVVAIIDYLLAYGLWVGRRWAWIGSIGLSILGIVFTVVTLFLRPGAGDAIELIFYLAIVYCLMQPNVQAYFGRSVATSPPSLTSTKVG